MPTVDGSRQPYGKLWGDVALRAGRTAGLRLPGLDVGLEVGDEVGPPLVPGEPDG